MKAMTMTRTRKATAPVTMPASWALVRPPPPPPLSEELASAEGVALARAEGKYFSTASESPLPTALVGATGVLTERLRVV